MSKCKGFDVFDPINKPIAQPLLSPGGIPIQGFPLSQSSRYKRVACCPGMIYSPYSENAITINGRTSLLITGERLVIPNGVYQVEFTKAGVDEDVRWSTGYPISKISDAFVPVDGMTISTGAEDVVIDEAVVLIGNTVINNINFECKGTRLRYQWLYCKEKNGTYTKLEEETESKLEGDSSMTSGFYKCSVTSAYEINTILSDPLEIYAYPAKYEFMPAQNAGEKYGYDAETEHGGSITPNKVPTSPADYALFHQVGVHADSKRIRLWIYENAPLYNEDITSLTLEIGEFSATLEWVEETNFEALGGVKAVQEGSYESTGGSSDDLAFIAYIVDLAESSSCDWLTITPILDTP